MLSFLLFIGTFLTIIFLAIRNSAIFIFVLYQAYYFFNPQTKWWSYLVPDLRFSFYIVLTLLIIVVFKWGSLKENKISAIPQFWFMYFIVLLYGIAYYYAVWPDIHAIALDALVTVAVVITLAFKLVTKEKHLDYIIWGYITFAAYLGYYISQFGRTSGGRFSGAGMVDAPDGNGVAAALAPALILTLYYFWQRTTFRKKLPFIIAGFFLATALVQLGSRGAFLGVAVGALVFIYYLFFSSMQRKNQKLTVIGIALFGVLGVATVTDQLFWERMLSIKTEAVVENTEIETGATRTQFWKAAIDMARDHPFGAGASGFIAYSHLYIPENINTGSSRNRAVHSTWFETLSEIGYLGLVALCGMIFYSFITLFRAAKLMKKNQEADKYFKIIAVMCALLCFVVTMTFLNRLRGEILYWCVLYTAVSYNIYYLKVDKLNKHISKNNTSTSSLRYRN